MPEAHYFGYFWPGRWLGGTLLKGWALSRLCWSSGASWSFQISHEEIRQKCVCVCDIFCLNMFERSSSLMIGRTVSKDRDSLRPDFSITSRDIFVSPKVHAKELSSKRCDAVTHWKLLEKQGLVFAWWLLFGEDEYCYWWSSIVHGSPTWHFCHVAP